MFARLSFLAILTLGSMTFGANKGSRYIIFNGGGDEYNNRSDFEDDIEIFQNFFPSSSTSVLNAGGPKSPMVKLDKYGFVDRTFFGDVKLAQSEMKGTVAATTANLAKTISQAAEANPSAVTIVFSDHGTPTGVSAWQEEIKFSELKNVDQAFSQDTIVRRIHMHCFSGGAIKNFDPGASDSRSAKQIDVMGLFPKNRCGLSASKEDEYSMGINFEDFATGATEKPWDKIVKRKQAPSLMELKTFLQNEQESNSTPQLTSDYFLSAFAKKLCSDQPVRACRQMKDPRQKINELKAVSKVTLCERYETFSSIEAQHDDAAKSKRQQLSQLGRIQNRVALEYLKEKNPTEHEAFKKGFEARETVVFCANKDFAGSPKCSNLAQAKKDAQDPRVNQFMEKILTLTSGGQFRKIPFLDEPYNFKNVDPEFEKRVQREYDKAPVKGYSSSYKIARNEMGRELHEASKERKEFYSKHEAEIQSSVLDYLKQPENRELLERYQNIRKCETTPINSTY